MPRRRPDSGWTPKLRRHQGGLGTVRIDGVDYYCRGHKWPTGQKVPPAAVQAWYDGKVAEWLAGGRRMRSGGVFTVRDLIAQRVDCLESALRARTAAGRAAGQLDTLKAALRHLRLLCGDTPAAEFGPRLFRDYRRRLEGHVSDNPIHRGKRLSRRTINVYSSYVREAFRWAVGEEMIPSAVADALYHVRALTADQTDAPDQPPRTDPDRGHLRAALKAARPVLRAMIRLHCLTGARPGELCRIRAGEVDQSRKPWSWSPVGHKTAHRGKSRRLLFGPRARKVLAPLLAASRPEQHVFRGRFGQPLTPHAYRALLRRACERAGVPNITPYQLRHLTGTRVGARYGQQGASCVLENTLTVAKVYDHSRLKKARRIVEEMG